MIQIFQIKPIITNLQSLQSSTIISTNRYRSFRWSWLSQINLQYFQSSAVISTKRNRNQQNSFKIHNQKRENSNFWMIARRWCRWYRSSRSEGYRQTDRRTDRRLTSSIFGDRSTQKALKGKNIFLDFSCWFLRGPAQKVRKQKT